MLFRFQFHISILCAMLCFGQNSFANKKLTENYISTYRDIAISEMQRTGIPASIKLAQGILESDLGRSPLAYHANNHFGIKCGREWNGEAFYKLDDDTDSTGTLIESCFRVFSSGEESYMAHSAFLTNPSKSSRYGFLFALGSTDYVGWANGLKFAGYATDPSYPSKLIKIIENNKLHQYDQDVKVEPKFLAFEASKEKVQIKDKTNEPQIVKADQKIDKSNKKEKENSSSQTKYKDQAYKKSKYGQVNDLSIIYASGNESVEKIARRTGKDVFELLEYNEELKSPDYIPTSNEIVFLERKKKNISSDGPLYHIVNDGETMYVIAQRYGIRLESLLAKNNLHRDAIPMKGETVSLVSHLSKKDTPKYRLVEKFDSYVDLGGLK